MLFAQSKKILKVHLFLIGVLSFCYAGFAYAESWDDKIKHADTIKSTDFPLFTEILSELSNNSNLMNSEQVEYVKYLSAYHFFYSRTDIENGMASLKELALSSPVKNIQFKATALIVNMLVLSRRYTEAFEYVEGLKNLTDDIEDADSTALAYGSLALLFNQINQFDNGLFYSDKMIGVADNPRYVCVGLQLKIEALYRLNRFDDFEALFSDGINSCNDAGQPIYANIIRSFKINSLIKSNPALALEMLQASSEEVAATNYVIVTSSFQAFFSQVYQQLGQLELAETHALNAETQITTQYVNPAVLIIYETLYDLYRAKGDYQRALKYHEILVAKQKTYDDEKAAGLLAYNLAKADVEVKNQRIELLNKDNELLFLQKNVYEQEVRQTRILVAVLIIVLSIASILAYKGLTGRRRFKKIAEFDQLTGISNRYHFNNQAAVALNYCEKNQQPAAVILFDLDHFKQINDTHGHAAGDWALQAVVATCRNFMRNNDVFGRIGGEEFAVILPGCQTDKAALLAEICRDAIAAIDTEESGTAFPLTASFGVSGSDTSGYQLKQLLADADTAMYRAKDSGRDQVASFAEA